jgi:hypothetical protein
MRVSASPIQTYINGSAQSQDLLRQEQIQQTAREQDKARQREQQATLDQTVQISDAARRVAQQREVVPTDKSAKSQRAYQYYPFPDNSGLSAPQQKALQTYSNNQNLSRTDTNGDFLGSVDVFA